MAQKQSGNTDNSTWDKFLKTSDDKLSNTGGEYLKLEVGETYNFKYHGIISKMIQGKNVDCAMLEDREGKRYICGTTVLVNNLEGITDIPKLVRINVLGMKPSGDGKNEYFDLEIFADPT
jgi:hypothetical protein